MRQIIRSGFAVLFALVSVVFISSTANANSLTYVLPGVSTSGYPNFTFGEVPNGKKNGAYPIQVTVKQVKKKGQVTGYELKAIGDSQFFFYTDASTYEPGKNGTFNLFAEFDTSEVLTGGSLEITGDLFGVSGTLVTADLVGDWNYDDFLIGFNTTNIWCNPLLNLNCSISESVYLDLKNGTKKKPKIFEGLAASAGQEFNAISITTVPVPAAVYLFGSGLLGLIGIARRRKTA